MSTYFFEKRRYGVKGLTERSGAAKAGHTFLLNKYYLDHLYTDIDRRRHQGPDSRGRRTG